MIDIWINTVQKGNPHGDGSDIEVLLFDHGNGFCNLSNIHDNLLDIVHSIKNRRTLNIDFDIQGLTESFKLIS